MKNEGSLEARTGSKGFSEISQVGLEIWVEFETEIRERQSANAGLESQVRFT